MITFILTTFLKVITFFIGLLPSSEGLPSGVTDAVARMGGLLYSFDFVLPIDLLFTIAQLVIGFEVAVLAYRFTIWIIHLIRGN